MERDIHTSPFIFTVINFNSHAHVERDHGRICQIPLMSISTHTLTWSVTCTQFWVDKCPKYFNSHAHVERDPFNVALKNSVTHFNSHAHVERDPFNVALKNSVTHFNSHAHVERDAHF